MKKERLKKTQQKNQVGEFSAMTSQVTKPPVASKLPLPSNSTSHIQKIQEMTAKIPQPMVMTSQLQQSSMTSQQSSNADARPESMLPEQNVDNFLEREVN